MFLTDLWYFGALSTQVKTGAPIHVQIAGQPVLIGRDNTGKVFALRDICPHRAMPLSRGRQIEAEDGQTQIECAYHGWRFGVDGVCTAIPSLNEDQKEAMTRGKIRTRRFAADEAQGLIRIYFAQDETAAPLMAAPRLDHVGDSTPGLSVSMMFDCPLDHAIIGLMDPAHIAYIHRQWWWRTAKSIHNKEKKFGPLERGFSMLPHVPSSNSFLYKLLGSKPQTEIRFELPGLRTEYVLVGGRQVTGFTAVTPVDDEHTKITIALYWDHPLLNVIPNFLLRNAITTFAGQDRDAVEAQQEGLKYDPRLMLIHDADVQAMWYFKLKKEWAEARAKGRAFVNPVKPATLRWRS
ncbi:MAG: 2Fe-2S ferredoxin [Robiginitomaculum sp.]|nr:MAG: 2Fe-2S ferredoxin [Robiginitomaculum sp.]